MSTKDNGNRKSGRGGNHKGGKTGGNTNGKQQQGNQGGSIQQAKYINMMLCRAAENGNVQGLLNLVASKHTEMTCVNFSTAMHKLARLVKENDKVINPADGRLALLHARIRAVLEEQVAAGPNVEVLPRCWATISWAYGTLQLRDPTVVKVLETIGQLSLPHLDSFNPLELTNLLWGFAKLQVPSARLFQLSCQFITAHLSSFSPSNLSTLVWAFVTAQQVRPGVLHQVAQEFVSRLENSEVNPVELANLMWGLATAKLHPKGNVLSEVGSRALAMLTQFKLQELSITAWAFSRLNARHDAFFAGVAQHLCRSHAMRKQIHSQGVANLLWAFERQKAMGSAAVPQLMLALRTLLPVCLQLLPDLKPQEFTCVFRALRKLGLSCGMVPEADELYKQAASVGGPLLRRLSLSQRVDLLEGFGGFYARGASAAPEICQNFVAALLKACFEKERDLESLGSMRIVELAATATLMLGAVQSYYVGMVASFALQLSLEQLPGTGVASLASMCNLPVETDLVALRSTMAQLAQGSRSSRPEVSTYGLQADPETASVASGTSGPYDDPGGYFQPHLNENAWCTDEGAQNLDTWRPPAKQQAEGCLPEPGGMMGAVLGGNMAALRGGNPYLPAHQQVAAGGMGPVPQQPVPAHPLQMQALTFPGLLQGDPALLNARSLAVQALLEETQYSNGMLFQPMLFQPGQNECEEACGQAGGEYMSEPQGRPHRLQPDFFFTGGPFMDEALPSAAAHLHLGASGGTDTEPEVQTSVAQAGETRVEEVATDLRQAGGGSHDFDREARPEYVVKNTFVEVAEVNAGSRLVPSLYSTESQLKTVREVPEPQPSGHGGAPSEALGAARGGSAEDVLQSLIGQANEMMAPRLNPSAFGGKAPARVVEEERGHSLSTASGAGDTYGPGPTSTDYVVKNTFIESNNEAEAKEARAFAWKFRSEQPRRMGTEATSVVGAPAVNPVSAVPSSGTTVGPSGKEPAPRMRELLPASLIADLRAHAALQASWTTMQTREDASRPSAADVPPLRPDAEGDSVSYAQRVSPSLSPPELGPESTQPAYITRSCMGSVAPGGVQVQ